MINEPPSKTWVVVVVAIIGAAGVIIAAIISLGLPFAERIADTYYPPLTPIVLVITPTITEMSPNVIPVSNPTAISPAEIPTAIPQFPTEASVQANVAPLREHYQVSVGDGIFASGTFSDGLAPYSESWLWDNNHFKIQRIRPEENPNGCDISRYNSNLIWISGTTRMQFSVNDKIVGTYTAADDPHGYIFEFPIKMGDKLCAVNFTSVGYSIIIGTDIYYHYDSYCYRGNC